jgi:hypothetical protein
MVKETEFATEALYQTREHPSPLFGVPVTQEDYFYSIDAKLFAVRIFLEGEAAYRNMLSVLKEKFGPPIAPGKWTWQGSKIKISLSYEAATERSLLAFSNDEFKEVHVECQEPAALAACLQRWSATEMTASDIRRFINEGLPDCFPVNNPDVLSRFEKCLPLQVGKDARNGRTLEVSYHCSDVCPAYGRIFLTYRGVFDEKSCCAAGGSPSYKYPGRVSFAGCQPPEMQSPEPVRDADGNMKLGLRSLCDPTAQPIIVGDLPTPEPIPVCTIGDVEAEPEEGAAPLTVQFEAEADCADKPIHYMWDFGDGTKGGDTPRPSHTYKNPGEYTATLVVRSPESNYEPDESDVTVNVTAK